MGSNVFLHGQSVLNVNPSAAVPLSIYSRDPNSNDTMNFTLGWHWLNKANGNLWYLASQIQGVANWLIISSGGSGPILEIAGNTGEAFPASGVITIEVPAGQGTASIVGNDQHTLNLSFSNIATGNIGLGTQSLNSVTSGVDNTAYGIETLSALTTGENNIAIGPAALTNLTIGSRNIAIGTSAGFNLTDENDNLYIGNNVEGTPGDENTLRIGNGSGAGVGQLASAFISGIYGVTVGSPQFVTIDSAGQLGSQAGGSGSGVQSFLASPSGGTAVPSGGVITLTGSGGATVTCSGSTINVSASSSGTGIVTIDGDTSSITGTTVAFHANALSSAGSSVSFQGNGTTTMALNLSDSNLNTIIGGAAGNGSISGGSNTGLGVGVFDALTSGSQNVALGYNACNALTTSGNNVAIGASAMGAATSASTNVAIGGTALGNLLTGIDNTCIGYSAGGSYVTSESSNICIGFSTTGTAAESNTLRIGNATGTSAGNLNAAYIQGIYGKTPSSPQFVTINSSGQLGSATGISGSSSVVPTSLGINLPSGGTSSSYAGPYGIGGSSSNALAVPAWPVSGTFSNLYVSITINTLTISTVVTVYVEGSATALTVTIPASTTGIFSNTSNTAAITVAQRPAFFYGTTGTGSGQIIGFISCDFTT